MATPPDPTQQSLLWQATQYIAAALAGGAISGVFSYWAGRVSKTKELLTTDLSERAKEFRELVSTIEKDAVAYWRQDQSILAAQIGDDLQASLHRMQGLRTYCEAVCRGFGSSQIRLLEDQYWEAITGGSFQGMKRKADESRVRLIRLVAADLTAVALRARRADLFVIGSRLKGQ